MTASLRRLTTLACAVTSIAACSGERSPGPVIGHAVIRARTTTVSVGDTLHLNAGILLNDGRFVPFDSVEFFSESPTRASIDRYTGVMTALAAGAAIIRTHAPDDDITLDTTLTIVP